MFMQPTLYPYTLGYYPHGYDSSWTDPYTSQRITINIISLREIQISGTNRDLRGTSIMVIGNDGIHYMAGYNGTTRFYTLPPNQKLVPGVTYRIQSSVIAIPMNQQFVAIPNLLVAQQIASNQVKITYDRVVDLSSAINPANYWIRVNTDRPVGIGSIGMNETLNTSNGLNPATTVIQPADRSGMKFNIIFMTNAVPGVMHEVLPCFVNAIGKRGYRDENWSPSSSNKFIAK